MSELSLTPTQLDSLTIEPGTTIRLAPGTYTVRGPWTIPPRCVVRGAGMWNTTIESSDDRTSGVFVVGTYYESDGCCTISDLTINGKFSVIGPKLPLAQRKIDGLALFGSHNVVERVRVIDWGGTIESGAEAYGIILASKSSNHIESESINNVVRNCIVEGGSGSYNNGIGSGSTVRGALIEGNYVKNITGTVHGAGIGCNASATVINNTVDGALWGFYSEAGIDLNISGNRFLDCRQRGIRLLIGAKNTNVSGNLFEMLGEDEGGAIVFDMAEKDKNPITGSRIDGNTVRLKSIGGKPTRVQGIMLPVSPNRGQIVTGNFLDSRIIEHKIAKDAVCLGNRTLTGGMIASLPDRKGNWRK